MSNSINTNEKSFLLIYCAKLRILIIQNVSKKLILWPFQSFKYLLKIMIYEWALSKYTTWHCLTNRNFLKSNQNQTSHSNQSSKQTRNVTLVPRWYSKFNYETQFRMDQIRIILFIVAVSLSANIPFSANLAINISQTKSLL